ncbi:uncharacterized protein rbbp8l isoform 2-T2 [Odontesthes bonariensis]|uniref:uncharacterized protein rbbp8l isoform X2 n=1 Tax=Odontesthes bonariensis TaxID=219752 RepID=UPI003F58A7A9
MCKSSKVTDIAMEGFDELLHKLQEAHERELEGWQVKVKELSNKKGCDTKRMEELFTRNQQMKEQHRLLTENIKTLENRLRAGLCDRCTVTQDVAKRRQQEFEASQIQSLQHISLLAGEMTNLKKENMKLKDEIKNLRAALEGHSKHTSNSNTTADAKRNSSPELSHSSGPVALHRGGRQPADGGSAVKTEADLRSEETECRQPRGTSRSSFEIFKPQPTLPSPTWRVGQSGGERRTVEVLDQLSSIPPQTLRKNPSSSPSGEMKLKRTVLHAPIPCHPKPVKGGSFSLRWPLSESSDWTAVAAAGINPIVQSPSKLQLPRFPNIIPPILHARGPSFGPPWQKQSPPQHPTKEPTVIFKLRSLTEGPTKPVEKNESPSCRSEKVPGERLKDTCDGPLDLSDRGKSKSGHTPKDGTPTASQSDLKIQRSPSSDVNAQLPGSSPPLVLASSSSSTPFKQQDQEPARDHNHQVVKEQEQKEESSGKMDQSNRMKVPVLTLSLRPVVMLETLSSALQRQETTSSNGKSSSPVKEVESSSNEQDEDESGSGQDSNQGCKRKRASVETETDRDSETSNIHHERRIKITVRTDERSPS